MRIAGHEIGKEPFIVAEAGLNHNGNIDRALEMVRVAASCGVNAVKFQTFKAKGVCASDQIYTYQSQGREITEPRINIFRRAELPDKTWPILKAACDKHGVIFLSTPQNPRDVNTLTKVGVLAIKIGSDDLTNLPMLRYCAKQGLPIILSCGMSTEDELDVALGIIGSRNVCVLACTSLYPCSPEEANVARITTLCSGVGNGGFDVLAGFSDHTHYNTDTASIMAVALGACMFERHFTLGHDLPGPEHCWACEPHDLRRWVMDIREAWLMRGDGSFVLSERETEQKRKYQRKAVV